MELNEFKGPYQFGQKPHPCGHYAPDVLPYQDSLSRENAKKKVIIRTNFCFVCDSYVYEKIPLDELSESLLKELAENDTKVYATLEELTESRKRHLEIIFAKSDW
jgi:hypothetical protein